MMSLEKTEKFCLLIVNTALTFGAIGILSGILAVILVIIRIIMRNDQITFGMCLLALLIAGGCIILAIILIAVARSKIKKYELTETFLENQLEEENDQYR